MPPPFPRNMHLHFRQFWHPQTSEVEVAEDGGGTYLFISKHVLLNILRPEFDFARFVQTSHFG